jgi:uncharacterized protein YaaN involved in tellurite resistance
MDNYNSATAQREVPELANIMPDDKKINFTKLTEEERSEVNRIVAAVPVLDSNAVATYGNDAQRKMNGYLDELLKGIRVCDAGQAGVITMELAKHIKSMNLPKMKAEAEGTDWVMNIPIIGKQLSAIRYFMASHEQILKQLNELENKAQREIGKLMASNANLDKLAEATLENINGLELYLAAGQVILLRAKADFAKRKESLADSNDLVEMAQLRDMAGQINAFEARLLKMHIAFTDSLTSIPQIRLNQEAAKIEINNIMDTIQFDIPRLKSGILRVASLKQILDASKDTKEKREITRQIGALGADALDAAYTQAKMSQGDGIEDVAILAATADKILETMAKGVRIDEENRQKNAQAEQQLNEIKQKLLEGMKANTEEIINSMKQGEV